MSEPTSTTAGVAIAAGTITLTGSIFGLHYDMLLAGFFGGLVSLSFLPPMPRLRVASTVATASVCAGLFGDATAVAALHYFPYMGGLGAGMRIAAGAGVGVCLQPIVSAVFRKISSIGRARHDD